MQKECAGAPASSNDYMIKPPKWSGEEGKQGG